MWYNDFTRTIYVAICITECGYAQASVRTFDKPAMSLIFEQGMVRIWSVPKGN
jgi:hypothetical protein